MRAEKSTICTPVDLNVNCEETNLSAPAPMIHGKLCAPNRADLEVLKQEFLSTHPEAIIANPIIKNGEWLMCTSRIGESNQ